MALDIEKNIQIMADSKEGIELIIYFLDGEKIISLRLFSKSF
jgi:hypothetical protein